MCIRDRATVAPQIPIHTTEVYRRMRITKTVSIQGQYRSRFASGYGNRLNPGEGWIIRDIERIVQGSRCSQLSKRTIEHIVQSALVSRFPKALFSFKSRVLAAMDFPKAMFSRSDRYLGNGNGPPVKLNVLIWLQPVSMPSVALTAFALQQRNPSYTSCG